MPDKEKKKEEKSPMEKRLDAIGWGLFLIMIGGLWLAPEWTFPEGSWLIGTGIIILGLSLVRYLKQLPVTGFMVFVGVLALGLGLGDALDLDLPLIPILLIIFGAGMILKP